MKRIFALAFALAFLCACARSDIEPVVDAQNTYVILPANYIVDIAADSSVLLNPAIQEFAVFSKVKEAREALDRIDATLKKEWRIYRLQGEFAELAQKCGPDGYCLSKPAKVVDWLDD